MHSSFEGRQIDLVESAIAEVDVYHVTSVLLIVKRKVLDAGSHAVLLHAADVRHNHRSRQTGVFAHILEVSPVERRAVDIHAGSEQHLFVAIKCFLADTLAVEE